jgi:hypothetical protein
MIAEAKFPVRGTVTLFIFNIFFFYPPISVLLIYTIEISAGWSRRDI